jgi:hypothetical protein
MEFLLRYRGPLPANGGVADKQLIRAAIHPQLEELCRQEPLLHGAAADELSEATLKGGQVKVAPNTIYFFVAVGGFRVVPIIHTPHKLACGLDILFLRRERPGTIVAHGGDLDNRLKTLFDALRMPHNPEELRGITPRTPDERLYCLLEDDALITRVSVITQQLLEPLASTEEPSTVELLIRVEVNSTAPIYANFGF